MYRMTERMTPLAGVMGWPIGHSRSPALHGHWLRRYGIEGSYVALGVIPQDFETAFAALPKLGFRGVNVTIPFKEAALSLANAVSDCAALIGAANSITFRHDGGIVADNTDGYGFLQNLRQGSPGWSAAAGPALVVGAGGAARAVVWALLSDGAPEIRLVNRTLARAERLRDHFGARITVIDWSRASDAAEGAGTIVNTTSLGMTGQADLPLRLDAAPRTALVTDIVYRPLETPLLQRARHLGLETVDGLGMLLHQAVPGFESWFGRRPEVDEELRAAVLAA
jgi:shikimate dehydrogenase